jgi:hypothetical protein
MGINQDFKLPGSDPLEVAPTELPLILETESYRQVVPDGTSSIYRHVVPSGTCSL